MFSIAEALQSNWLQTYYTGIFLVYIYITATALLLLLQLYILPISKKKNETESSGQCMALASPAIVLAKNDTSPTILEENNNNTINETAFTADTEFNDSGFRSQNGAINSLQRERHSTIQSKKSADFNDHRSRTFSSGSQHAMEHQHILGQGHEVNQGGSSFYLRIGLLVFGMGHLIYVIMEIKYRMIGVPEGCSVDRFSWTFILRLLFLAVQTFFLFKNPTVNITKLMSLSEFSFKHLISTNTIVWLRTLISEIEESLLHSEGTSYNSSQNETLNDSCVSDWQIIAQVRPYLFPFVLEYSLIAVGICGVLCSKVIHRRMHRRICKSFPRQDLLKDNQASTLQPDEAGADMKDETLSESEAFGPMHCKQHHTKVTFKSSNRGLLLGAAVLCCAIVSIIIFFFDLTADNLNAAQKNFVITDITLHSLMLVACIGALWSLNELPLKQVSFTQVDDILLFIAMSGSFFFEISIVISCSVYLQEGTYTDDVLLLNVLALTSSIVSVVQTLLQTILIELGLRKYCSSSKQQDAMRGREAITFLIVCNVTMWIFRTMQVKEIEMGIQEDFYGALAWNLIMTISLPFLLFFYFHSSICLADIWIEAYHYPLPTSSNTKKAAVDKSDSILSYINSSFANEIELDDNEFAAPVIDTTYM